MPLPASTTSERPPRATVWALVLAQVLGSIAAACVLTVASTSVSVLTNSDGLAGLGQASIIVGASLITIPIARLAQRRGRRASLMTAYVVASIGALGCALSFTFGAWPALLLCLLGCGGATVAGLAARFAATDSANSPAQVPVLMGIVMSAATVGSILGPNLATPLGALFGERYFAQAFLVVAAVDAAAVAVLFVLMPRVRVAGHERGLSLRTQLRILTSDVRVGHGVFVSVIGHMFMVGLMALAPVSLHHHGAAPGVIGVLMSVHMASMYVLSPLVGKLIAQFGANVVSLAAFAVFTASSIMLSIGGFRGDDLFMMVGMLLLGLGWSGTMISGSAIVTEAAGPKRRVAVQGATDLCINVFGGVASILCGLFASFVGYGGLALLCVALVLFTALVARWLGARSRQQQGARTA